MQFLNNKTQGNKNYKNIQNWIFKKKEKFQKYP